MNSLIAHQKKKKHLNTTNDLEQFEDNLQSVYRFDRTRQFDSISLSLSFFSGKMKRTN